MKFLKISLITITFALFITACGDSANNAANIANNTIVVTNSNPNAAAQPTASDEIASAREIYIISCSKCHKENGTGGKVSINGKNINAENLTTDKMKNMSDAKYIGYIENGIPDEGMPAFKGRLTEQQIKDVVNYIRKELQK